MANYQDNRIRCSRDTAMQLITSSSDGYRSTIDFRKALGMNPDEIIHWDYSSQEIPVYVEMADGRYDFGFQTRWYSSLETIRAFIARYHEAEWWIQQDYVDIYHYYWSNEEVVEDVHEITDEEEDCLSDISDKYWEQEDRVDHFPMIFTEKENQDKYINFHPDKQSKAYAEYQDLVRKIATEIVEEGFFFALKDYGYNWEGAYRYYGLAVNVRANYLYKRKEDLSAYKMNIMSLDVLNEIQRLKYPYDKKLYDAVFGLAIGDALGVPYEFKKRGTFKCKGFTGNGTHGQPPGTWSDDTSMTLATLKSLKDNHGKVNVENIRKNFLKWYRKKAFTVDGTLFDIGNATAQALSTGQPCTEEDQNGNGSLMRILPLAFVDCTDDEIRAVSGITHAHWISEEACVIYVHIARRLLAGEEIRDIIPTLKYDKPFDRLCKINELDRSEIRSSGYVVDTLEAALWAVSRIVWTNKKHTCCEVRDYEKVVFDAINLGDDTDTVGAVAGGLAGIIFGLDFGGYEWIKDIRNNELILSCLWDRL